MQGAAPYFSSTSDSDSEDTEDDRSEDRGQDLRTLDTPWGSSGVGRTRRQLTRYILTFYSHVPMAKDD